MEFFELKLSHFIDRLGAQKLVPPSRAEMENPLGELSIEFLNTIYLKIIWGISWSTINHFRLNGSMYEISHVSFAKILPKSAERC